MHAAPTMSKDKSVVTEPDAPSPLVGAKNKQWYFQQGSEKIKYLKGTYYAHFQVHMCILSLIVTCLHALMFKKLFIFLIVPLLNPPFFTLSLKPEPSLL